ncbi:hypothetical protein K7432_007280 [Basidiobolus ranarum]|uniref:F-box domain-containing protein n=1 Tax=Basidiobolus ranarum TaxID=34480 RepID=A0ABR2WTL1_9FUNG
MLTYDIIANVFAYLSPKERYSCLYISKLWNELTTPLIWAAPKPETARQLNYLVYTLNQTRRRRIRNLWRKAIFNILATNSNCLKRYPFFQSREDYFSTRDYGVMIQILDLSEVKGKEMITDYMITTMARNCPNLIKANLYNCFNLTDKSISQLLTRSSHLTWLSLSVCTGITDEALLPLTTLQRSCPLTHLSLNFTLIQGKYLSKVLEVNPDLNLTLDQTNLYNVKHHRTNRHLA